MKTTDLVTSLAASSLNGWRGSDRFRPAKRQPEQLLELYEFEACPYCRMVREALTELDIDAMIYPCPKGGTFYRPKVKEMGGKFQFPYLVDPNTGMALYESADILRYLYATYGERQAHSGAIRRQIKLAGSSLATAARVMKGMHAKPSKRPEQPLELFSFESSPYSRPVRELLSELEIPYRLRNMAKAYWREYGPSFVRATLAPNLPIKGRNRQVLHERTGRLQVPYLIDPNTGTEMFESQDILQYLQQTYAA